jgi:LL-diaminopimelate aminotransferase
MKTTADRMQVFPDHFFAGLNSRIRELQAQGQDVIRLDIGSPDLPPDPHIIEALKRSAERSNSHGYQPHQGLLSLRQAWVDMYQRLYQVDLDPQSEVQPLLGSKEGIFNLVMSCVNPGDMVLVPDPGYLTYNAATRFAGGEPVFMPLTDSHDFLPDLEAIPKPVLDSAKMLWLNYPNNPTAGVADLDFFTQVVDLAHEHHLLVCHDAAYSQVTFDGYQAPSILQVPGAKTVAVEFNTLSKSHNMAGWRTGVAVGYHQVIKQLHDLKTNVDSGHFLPVMEASAAALHGDQTWLVDRNLVYQQRRDSIVMSLQQMGLNPGVSKASLYVWCPIPDGWGSGELAAMLLEDAGISLTPGDIFGSHGEGYIRISLTVPQGRIDEAMQRMDAAIQASGRN